MKRDAVMDLLRRDTWDIASDRSDAGVALVRYRAPVLAAAEVSAYDHVVKVDWRYAPNGLSVLPTEAQTAEMDAFEDRLCDAVERDGQAIVAAIFTFEGRRQWIVYTGDAATCRAAIGEVDTIELATEPDPGWRYLHEILKRFPRQKAPA